MTQPPSVESVFSRSWELLSRNWIIIVPGIVIGLIVGIIGALLTPHIYTSADYANNPNLAMAQLGGVFIRGIILGCVGVVGYLATVAFTVGMAGAAWARGTTTIADGTAGINQDPGNVVVVGLAIFVLGIIAAVLAIPTLTLSLLALYLFTLYALPAAILGKAKGMAAITESFQMATKRFWPTLIIVVVIGVVKFVIGLATLPLIFIPFLGPIVTNVITHAVIAFAVLVIVGEYLSLRNQGVAATAAYPPGPSGPV
jgi:membrane-anchored glycerophosphoryl diester phosphodiesterase (GDPDase)